MQEERKMSKKLLFHFYNAGAHDGETETRVMVNFWSNTDGRLSIGQSQLVRSSEWPKFREYLELGGWQNAAPPH
jgi:hypothetical protein